MTPTLMQMRDGIRQDIRDRRVMFAHNNDDEWSPVWAYGMELGRDGVPLADYMRLKFGTVAKEDYIAIPTTSWRCAAAMPTCP